MSLYRSGKLYIFVEYFDTFCYITNIFIDLEHAEWRDSRCLLCGGCGGYSVRLFIRSPACSYRNSSPYSTPAFAPTLFAHARMNISMAGR